MKTAAYLVVSVFVLAGTVYVAPAAGDSVPELARVGEVRAFAVGPGNSPVIAQLHHDGWLEARGQLLSARECQALFKIVGRTWTVDSVGEDRFAIPDLHTRSGRLASSDNPFGVLGPGDLVTSGRADRQWLRQSPITYWIFTGQDVTRLETFSAPR